MSDRLESFKRVKSREDSAVKYWFENPHGDIISYVKYPFEIRISYENEQQTVVYPLASKEQLENLSPEEVLRSAKMQIGRRKMFEKLKQVA